MKKTSPLNRWDLALSVLTALAVALFGLCSSDKQFLFANNPDLCGIYCTMAVHYGAYLQDQAFDPYYFQKSFFSLVSYLGMTLSGHERTPLLANALLERMSALLLAGSALLWFAIGRFHGLSRTAYWIGFTGLFLCQLFMKLVPYAQESPDTGAFFIGLAGLYAVTCARHKWIVPVYMCALFIQPQFKIFLIPVYVLSYGASEPMALPSFAEKLCGRGLVLCEKARAKKFQGAGLLFALYAVVFSVVAIAFPHIKPLAGAKNMIYVLLPFSIFLASLFFSYAFYKLNLFGVIESVLQRMTDRLFWTRLGLIVCLEVASRLLTLVFARGELMSGTSTMISAMYTYVGFYYQSVEQPLKFIVAPVVFYGPVFVLLLLSLKRMHANIPKLSDPLPVTVGIISFLLLFPDTESRHFIAFLPWFVLLAVLNRTFSYAYLALFGGLSLFFSRFYADYAPIGPDQDPYLMTWGPWYTQDIYWQSLVVAVLLSGCLWAGNKYLQGKHGR